MEETTENILDDVVAHNTPIQKKDSDPLHNPSMDDIALRFERMRHLGKMNPPIDIRNDQRNIDN